LLVFKTTFTILLQGAACLHELVLSLVHDNNVAQSLCDLADVKKNKALDEGLDPQHPLV
jgi:hypothetical protein